MAFPIQGPKHETKKPRTSRQGRTSMMDNTMPIGRATKRGFGSRLGAEAEDYVNG